MRLAALGVTDDGQLVDPKSQLDGSLDDLTGDERNQVVNAVMLMIWRGSMTASEQAQVRRGEEILERHGLNYRA